MRELRVQSAWLAGTVSGMRSQAMMSSWIIYAGVGVIILGGLGLGLAFGWFIAPGLRVIESRALRRLISRDARRVLRTQPLFWTPGVILLCVFVFVPVERLAADWGTFALSLVVGGTTLVHSRFCWRRAIRRAMIANLRCFGCGYNLAGNVSGVCQECGTAVG